MNTGVGKFRMKQKFFLPLFIRKKAKHFSFFFSIQMKISNKKYKLKKKAKKEKGNLLSNLS